MSPDPATIHGLSADLNPYAYVSGGVYNQVDPMGLNGKEWDCPGCGGGDTDSGSDPGAQPGGALGQLLSDLGDLFTGGGGHHGGTYQPPPPPPPRPKSSLQYVVHGVVQSNPAVAATISALTEAASDPVGYWARATRTALLGPAGLIVHATVPAAVTGAISGQPVAVDKAELSRGSCWRP